MSEDLQRWVEEVILNYFGGKKGEMLGLEWTRAVAVGDNYSSLIYRVAFSILKEYGDVTKGSVIVKSLPVIPPELNYLKSCYFPKELMVYENFIPKLEHLDEQINYNVPSLFPKCFGVYGDECFIFQDLESLGYKYPRRRVDLTFQETALIVEGLARLHALSKIAHDRGLVNLDKLPTSGLDGESRSLEAFVSNRFYTFLYVVRNHWDQEWLKTADLLESKIVNILIRLKEANDYNDDKLFRVLNHGDLWTCNAMFKYNAELEPTSVKFVDYQLSHYNSYSWDLVHFFSVSLPPDLERNRKDDIISIYLSKLKSTFQAHDFPTDLVPTLQEVNAELKRLRVFEFFCKVMVLPIGAQEQHISTTASFLKDFNDDEEPPAVHVYKSERFVSLIQRYLKEIGDIDFL